jgi:hypothetical protein
MRKFVTEVGSSRRLFRDADRAIEWATKKALQSGERYFYLTDSISAETEKYEVEVRVTPRGAY